MASSTVRVPPLAVEDFTAEQAKLVGDWHHLVFSRVLVRHPGMYATFVPFLAEIVTRSTLPPRDREIALLRILRLCNETYEYTHHLTIAERAGMSEDEISAAAEGEGAALSEFDRIIVRAAEQLQRDQFIDDGTWKELSQRYTQEQIMELVCLGGCYMTMAVMTKNFGMELEGSPEVHERINALRNYT